MVSSNIPSNQQVDGFSRKPKRPKVYAIRTFPQECGALMSKMNLDENDNKNSTIMAAIARPKVYAIRTFPEGCGGAHMSKMKLEENDKVDSAIMAIDRPKVNPIPTFHVEVGGAHVSKMNLEENSKENSRKIAIRRPKVYAINRFPEGCGAIASTRNLEKSNKENSAIMAIDNHHLVEKDLSTSSPSRQPSSIMDTTLVRGKTPTPIDYNKKPLQVVGDDLSQQKVKYALDLFQEMLAECQVAVSNNNNGSRSRADMMAAKLLKMKQKWINTSQRLGDVPGVNVGDTFEWMAELNVVGLHHQLFNGIDYMETNGKKLATSIVASGRYANSFEHSDALIYSGQGGNPCVRNSPPEDQKLERGNLALKNSMEAKTPVRVIRGCKLSKSYKLTGTSCRRHAYVYDGLYYVHDNWQERGEFGKLVFKFLLKRIFGQPELHWTKTSEQINNLKRDDVFKGN